LLAPASLLALLLLVALAGPSCFDPLPRRPNVVVVLLDTLRPDHLGFYGYERETAPFLAELATRSVVFLDAVSTSGWTAPSTASLFTSLHPIRHGVLIGMVVHLQRAQRDASVDLNRLPDDVATLPELLRPLGYRTFGIAANPNIGAEIGFSRGFDRFARIEPRAANAETDPETAPPGSPLRWGDAEAVYGVLRSWQDELRAGAPYFLYLHLNDTHHPYQVRRPWFVEPDDPGDVERRSEAAYDSEIGFADAVLKRIDRELDLEHAIVVVVSDHGEAFGEHGRRFHHHGLYRELNRILLMISAPDLGVQPGVVEERVSILSVLPTLFDLLGEPPPPGRDGISLAPFLRESPERAALEERLRERVVIAHRKEMKSGQPHTWAVMKGRWTLVREGKRVELYDGESDPEQVRNLVSEHPAIRADLEQELARFRGEVQARASETHRLDLDTNARRELEALGYIVDEDEGPHN
jgi:arylsulfatase A-like enzyme